ncbi:hypothetical protein B0J11DRAFT_549099 [Dendryphion nanum]|uniref:Amidohydrolase-related domain-containing protein n=1 Tax=Dendryphion nanum TaxID=256645 RepID=A0A9P9DXK0_9PLEO|nr:hypothetical protein B0J11DRAFT_549099 [Dendryphion nanum]
MLVVFIYLLFTVPTLIKPIPHKIAIDNVRIFDGYTIQPPRTIILADGRISKDKNCQNASHIDGGGRVLLPGLMDAHCHPTTIKHLESLAKYGVTTGLTMSCFTAEMCSSLAKIPGLPDLRFASAPASAPGSAHGNITARIDPKLLINDLSEIPAWMNRQVGFSDYVKVIAETPGFDQTTLNALVSEAKKRGKKTVMHASALEAYVQGIRSGTHHIHHAPLDSPLSLASPWLKNMKRNNQIATPTLTMMRSIALSNRGNDNYTAALLTTRSLHNSHIPILAGTDANEVPGVPAAIAFGSSLHDELDNLVEAGFSNLEALRAATTLPALHFGLKDRGVIKPGMRADLVLIEGNPLENIKALRNIQRVWIGGIEFTGL